MHAQIQNHCYVNIIFKQLLLQKVHRNIKLTVNLLIFFSPPKWHHDTYMVGRSSNGQRKRGGETAVMLHLKNIAMITLIQTIYFIGFKER